MLNALIPKVLTDRVVDSHFIFGYITKEDYRSYYMDSTRSFIPTWVTPNNELSDIVGRGNREQIVQNKNLALHNINMATKLLGE